jgi:hypothetical protein
MPMYSLRAPRIRQGLCSPTLLLMVLAVSTMAHASPIVYARYPACYQNPFYGGFAVPGPGTNGHFGSNVLRPFLLQQTTLIDEIDCWGAGFGLTSLPFERLVTSARPRHSISELPRSSR